jgi:hypothetical protein
MNTLYRNSLDPIMNEPIFLSDVHDHTLMKGLLKIIWEGCVDAISDIRWWSAFVV